MYSPARVEKIIVFVAVAMAVVVSVRRVAAAPAPASAPRAAAMPGLVVPNRKVERGAGALDELPSYCQHRGEQSYVVAWRESSSGSSRNTRRRARRGG